MLQNFLSSKPIWERGLVLIRIAVGIMLIRHGIEVFDSQMMIDYGKRTSDLHFPLPHFMAYLGKSMELIGGISLLFGFLTRIITIAVMITFLFISFGMGHGRILTEDQHPFQFVLLALVFFCLGSGRFSLDYLLFDRRKF